MQCFFLPPEQYGANYLFIVSGGVEIHLTDSSTLNQLGHFCQNVISFPLVVHYKCNIVVWNWFNIMNILWTLWLLMPWCLSTRASVATVRSIHPCVSSCLGVNKNNMTNSGSCILHLISRMIREFYPNQKRVQISYRTYIISLIRVLELGNMPIWHLLEATRNINHSHLILSFAIITFHITIIESFLGSYENQKKKIFEVLWVFSTTSECRYYIFLCI